MPPTANVYLTGFSVAGALCFCRGGAWRPVLPAALTISISQKICIWPTTVGIDALRCHLHLVHCRQALWMVPAHKLIFTAARDLFERDTREDWH